MCCSLCRCARPCRIGCIVLIVVVHRPLWEGPGGTCWVEKMGRHPGEV